MGVDGAGSEIWGSHIFSYQLSPRSLRGLGKVRKMVARRRQWVKHTLARVAKVRLQGATGEPRGALAHLASNSVDGGDATWTGSPRLSRVSVSLVGFRSLLGFLGLTLMLLTGL